MSYNGETFKYDELGNPTTYRGKELTWDYGRSLVACGNYSYKYNANGIRVSKTRKIENGLESTTTFFTNGTQILGQYDGNLMLFYYGVDGITGFKYEDNQYEYKKNILGDIIGIYDENGTQICKYVYDAWGKCRTYVLKENNYVDISDKSWYTEDSDIYEMMAILNPFRYRGYYFDIETGLYYLNTRYYDPETGRFINADDVSILNTSKDEINGLNLYAYCFNNPVNDIDEYGCWSLKKALKKSWKKIVRAVVVVAVAAAAIAVTVATLGASSIVIAGIVAATANTLGQVLIQGKTFSQVDWLEVGTTFFSVTIAAYVPGGLFVKSITETSVNALLNSILRDEKTTLSEFVFELGLNFGLSYASDVLILNINKYVGKTIFKSCINGLNVNTGAMIYKYTTFINQIIFDGLFSFLGDAIGG